MRMYNKLLNLQKELIDPIRNRPMYFIEMNATTPQKNDEITINIESLYFLLETEDKNIIGELANVYAQYISTLDAIDSRSQLHRTEAQPLLESQVLTRIMHKKNREDREPVKPWV